MSDIFREVDEDLRRERYSKLWKKHGWLIIAIAVVIILATAGYRGYQYYQNVQSAEAGARFQGAQNLLADDARQDAIALLQQIANDGSSPYDSLARFQLAGLGEMEPAERAALFVSLANDASLPEASRDLARVRGGYILLGIAPREEVVALVEPVNTPENAFRASGREILALAAYQAGDREAALNYFSEIVSDASSPATARARAEAYLDVIAGHEGNALELPTEPEPAPAPQPVAPVAPPADNVSTEPAAPAADAATEPAPTSDAAAPQLEAPDTAAPATDAPATPAQTEGAQQ